MRQRNIFQMMKQDKALGGNLNEADISNLLDKKVEGSDLKMPIELRRRVDEHIMNFRRF